MGRQGSEDLVRFFLPCLFVLFWWCSWLDIATAKISQFQPKFNFQQISHLLSHFRFSLTKYLSVVQAVGYYGHRHRQYLPREEEEEGNDRMWTRGELPLTL